MQKNWHKLAAVAALACSLTLTAQNPEQGGWRAASAAAKSTTGDIVVGAEKISINFYLFPISHIRQLQPTEVSAIFDVASTAAGSTGSLYRVDIKSNNKFLRKNTLCGSDDVTWMVAYPSGRTLQLAFFSGDKPPELNFDAMANATNRCGTFGYTR